MDAVLLRLPGMGKDNVIFNHRSKKDGRMELRNSGTAAEAVLWKHLQRSQLLGKLFHRQVSIGRYIVDFYCPECRLIIELDGAAHFSILKEEYEAERTRYLEGLGYGLFGSRTGRCTATCHSCYIGLRRN